MGFTLSRDFGSLGTVALQASWNDMLKHTYQLYPDDPVIDELRTPTYSTDLKSKANASITWTRGHWRSSVYGNRSGGSPNYLASNYGYGTTGAAILPSWTLYNFSAHYQWTPGLGLSLTVDNAFDSMPPADHSYPGLTSSPYNDGNYNVYGRSYFLQVNYQFGL
jgi:outer membrane receptor protein involved in Fe transport